MGVFIQRPFWSTGWGSPRAPHAVSVIVTEPSIEPITLDEAKQYARITHDHENGLIDTFRRSARHTVEQETGLALLTQTRDVYLDVLDGTVTLPAQSTPLQSVTWVKSTDTAGVINTLDPSNYVLDLVSGRIGLSLSGVWPTDLRPFQPITIRIVAGWVSALAMPAPLVHAVGLLTGHYANEGRDRFLAANLLDQYEAIIAPYRLVTVA